MINGLIGVFEAFVNSIIGGVNTMIRALNRLSFSFPSWMPGGLGGKKFGLNLQEITQVQFPRIPQLAEGGIVDRATLALIGEAGPEAVVPLDKLGAMGNVYNINVNAGLGTNGAEVGREIVAAIKRYERGSGKVFASA
jgi:hypothetical protein